MNSLKFSIKLAPALAIALSASAAHADAVADFQNGTDVMIRVGTAVLGTATTSTGGLAISKKAGTFDFAIAASDLGMPFSATVHLYGKSSGDGHIIYTINDIYAPAVAIGGGHTLSSITGSLTATATRVPGAVTAQIGNARLMFDGVSQLVANGDWGAQSITLASTELIGGIPQPALGALVATGDNLVCSDSVTTTQPLAVWLTDVAQGGGAAVDFKVPLHGIRLPASVLVQPGHRSVNVGAQIAANFVGTVQVSASSSGVTKSIDMTIHAQADCTAPSSSPAIEAWVPSAVAGCTSCTGYLDINHDGERLTTVNGFTTVVAGTQALELLRAFPDASAIGADTMNDDGSLAGRITIDGVTQAYRANVNHGTSLVLLGTMTPQALNNYNLVVGYRVVDGASEAVYSNGNGIVPYALTSSYGVAASRALDVNDDGRVIGTYTDVSGVVRGFASFDGVTTTLAIAKAQPAIPVAINSAGQIAANAKTAAGQAVAVILAPTGAITTTLDAPSGYATFQVKSINRFGAVAGVATTSNGVQRAFAWQPATGFIALTGHVAGLTATDALRITDANRVVVTGTYSGVTDLYLVTL